VINADGIWAIRIISPGTPGSSGSGIEVDHLQNGFGQAVAEPSTLTLLGIGALAVIAIVQRG
jgi:hypothetical protein